MPYTLKKNKFKYKNPDTGNYEGVDVVAERSFADYQSALENVGLQQQTVVRSEGTTQKNAVTAAGTAAVANFPATAAACDTLAGDFAATYVPDQAYAVGDYCTYQYQLYQCKTAIAVNTDHTFVTSHWNLITVTDTINDQVDDLKTQFACRTSYNQITPDHWSHGTYNSSDGSTNNKGTNVTRRIRASLVDFETQVGVCVIVPTGMRISIYQFESDGVTYSNNYVLWQEGTVYLYGNNKRYKLSADYADSSDMDVTAGDGITVFALTTIDKEQLDKIVEKTDSAIMDLVNQTIPISENLTKGARGLNGAIVASSPGITTEMYSLDVGTLIDVDASDGWVYTVAEGNTLNSLRYTYRLSSESRIKTSAKYVGFNLYKEENGELIDIDPSDYNGQIIFKVAKNITSVEPNEYTRLLPENSGVANVIRRAYQMTKISFDAQNTIPHFGNALIYEGQKFVGIPYSSVRPENLYVPQCVTFESFMTAVKNPNSYLYTRKMVIPGYSGHCYMGSVCSAFVAWCYGIKDTLPTTVSFATYPGFSKLQDDQQNWQSVKLGDMLNKSDSHILIVTDILVNRFGEITYIELSEETNEGFSTARSVLYPRNEITKKIRQGYYIYRYDYIADVEYTPSPWVHVDASETTAPEYNNVLIPRRGDKANWHEGEDIVIDILRNDNYTGYILEEYKTGQTTTGTISGDVITLSNLPAGAYRLKLTGATNSKNTYFDIKRTQGTSYEVLSNRRVKVTPYINQGNIGSVVFCCNNPNRGSDNLSVRSFHIFTDEEKAAGYAIVEPPEADSDIAVDDVWYMRCIYDTGNFGLYSSQLTLVDVTDSGSTVTEGAYERSPYIQDYSAL